MMDATPVTAPEAEDKGARQRLRDAVALLFRTAAEQKQGVVVLLDGGDVLAMRKLLGSMVAAVDPRHLHVLGEWRKRGASEPPLAPFWRALPPFGDALVCHRSYYTDLALARARGKIGSGRTKEIVQEIRDFEYTLTCNTYLLLKFMVPGDPSRIAREYQEARRKRNARFALGRGSRLVATHAKAYQANLEALATETDAHYARWFVVPPGGRRTREAAAFGHMCATLERALQIDSAAALAEFDEAMARTRTGA